MSEAHIVTPISSTPPNIHDLTGGSAMTQASMPPSAQATYRAQPNSTVTETQDLFWPPKQYPFGYRPWPAGFPDLTKLGMRFDVQFTFGEKFTLGMYRWSRRRFTHLFLIFILALYSLGGALLFKVIEVLLPHDKLELLELKGLQRNFFDEMRQMTKDPQLSGFLEIEFDSQVLRIMKNHSSAVESLLRDGLAEKPKPWSFWESMVYCCTIYTTIGYGYITPKTDLGRSLTIVYAIIGIPMFLIVMADLGKPFTRGVKFPWRYVRRLYYTRTCRRIRRQQQIRDPMIGFSDVYENAIRRQTIFFRKSSETNDEDSQAGAEAGRSLATSDPEKPTSPYPETFEVDDEFNLPVSVASLLVLSYILLGTYGYTLVESEWSTLDAFYYVFISMSTIGFGDLLPGNPFLVMVSMIYLIFGLALTSMFINVVQIKLNDHFKRASAKVGAKIGMNKVSECDEEGGSEMS
ncbi:potassium channel subfamily K member 9-like, partial [Drosophila rhopaloa]|uniref:Potassium channel domain-containing protein n=2 Tax=Drosophila rhopaloa TaxID=1041015 RepID=A0ABM5J0P8_DRORH